MKLPALFALLCISPFILIAQGDDAQAEKPVGVITKSSVIDTGWVDTSPMGDCPDTHYPVSIELMPLQGDGVRFRAVFIPKPSEGLDYKYVVSERTPKYLASDADYRKQGYVQICHQLVTVMVGNVHQAVWVRSPKEEQDGGEQPATRPESK
jgi:hypothetical protein